MRQEERSMQRQGRPTSPRTAQGRRAGEPRQTLPEKQRPGSHDSRSSVTARVSLVMSAVRWAGGGLSGRCRNSTASIAPSRLSSGEMRGGWRCRGSLVTNVCSGADSGWT